MESNDLVKIGKKVIFQHGHGPFIDGSCFHILTDRQKSGASTFILMFTESQKENEWGRSCGVGVYLKVALETTLLEVLGGGAVVCGKAWASS